MVFALILGQRITVSATAQVGPKVSFFYAKQDSFESIFSAIGLLIGAAVGAIGGWLGSMPNYGKACTVIFQTLIGGSIGFLIASCLGSERIYLKTDNSIQFAYYVPIEVLAFGVIFGCGGILLAWWIIQRVQTRITPSTA